MTIESAVNIPDDSSVTFTILFDNSTELNVFFLSEMSVSVSTFPSSDITSILFVYKHTNLLFSWYSILDISELFSPSYFLIAELSGFELAPSIDIVCILDFIIVPDVSISATAKYLLSFDIAISPTLFDA